MSVKLLLGWVIHVRAAAKLHRIALRPMVSRYSHQGYARQRAINLEQQNSHGESIAIQNDPRNTFSARTSARIGATVEPNKKDISCL